MSNLKKEEVYVVVDSEKKKQKFKDCIKQFGMQIYPSDEDKKAYSFNGVWFLDCDRVSGFYDRTKVSIKELRNILAKEYLKEGDVILATIGKSEYIVEVESTDYDQAYINGSKYYCSSNGSYQVYNGGGFHSFKRYATEEEKALLNPLVSPRFKEGDWIYRNCNNSVVCIKEYNEGGLSIVYGVDANGKWVDNFDTVISVTERLANKSEVQEALINEAIERRLILGANIRPLIGDVKYEVTGQYNYGNLNNSMSYGGCLIFERGLWATVASKPEPKTGADYKELGMLPMLEVIIDKLNTIEQQIEELKR